MKKTLSIFIGFIHDFAAGCWAATVFAVWWLERSINNGTSRDVLSGLQKEFFYIGIACAVFVLLAGAGRMFTYVGNFYGEEAERTRRKMLIIKHIVLLAVFGSGIFWQYCMAFN